MAGTATPRRIQSRDVGAGLPRPSLRFTATLCLPTSLVKESFTAVLKPWNIHTIPLAKKHISNTTGSWSKHISNTMVTAGKSRERSLLWNSKVWGADGPSSPVIRLPKDSNHDFQSLTMSSLKQVFNGSCGRTRSSVRNLRLISVIKLCGVSAKGTLRRRNPQMQVFIFLIQHKLENIGGICRDNMIHVKIRLSRNHSWVKNHKQKLLSSGKVSA